MKGCFDFLSFKDTLPMGFIDIKKSLKKKNRKRKTER